MISYCTWWYSDGFDSTGTCTGGTFSFSVCNKCVQRNSKDSNVQEQLTFILTWVPSCNKLIGMSLSEPHTSVTSLCTCVCMFAWLLDCLLGLTTYHKFLMSTLKYFTRIDCLRQCILQLSHESESERLLSDSSVGMKLSESEDDSSWMRLQHSWQLPDKSMLWVWRLQACTVARFASGKHLVWTTS